MELLDIYVSNLTSQWGAHREPFPVAEHRPARADERRGIAPFRQASEELGLSRSGWSWDCRLADFNNDGVLEALQANGFIKGRINKWPELQSLGTSNNQLLHNPKFWPSLQPGDDVSGYDTFAFFVRARDGRYYDVAPKLKLQDGVSMSEAMVTARHLPGRCRRRRPDRFRRCESMAAVLLLPQRVPQARQLHGAAPVASTGKGKGNARRAGSRSFSRGDSGPAGHRRGGGHPVAGRE